MKNKLFIFTVLFVLSLVGCPNGSDSTDNSSTGNGSNTSVDIPSSNNSNRISGLQANITVNAYMDDTQYSIELNAKNGTFRARPKVSLNGNQIIGRGDDTAATEITGSFVCNKTAAGDDLYWYAHNSAICLKPDTTAGSANTNTDCYKIVADLTQTTATDESSSGTDTATQTVNVNNKYCTSKINNTAYTAAETAAKTAWDHSSDPVTGVTFSEKQKTCLKKANTELANCTKKEVSSLTQTFDVDGNTTKDYTVGFSFNLGDTTCDVYIDKDNVKISTDQSSDFSRTTPTWLMDAVNTVITSGASPDDIKNCTELKDCKALQTVITELASAVGTSNDDVVYTESGKEGYKEIPCPWSDDELAKMKVFTENYKDEVGAWVTSVSYIEKFSNDDAFAKNADGDRTNDELIFIMGYGKIAEMIDDHSFNFGDEHVFGIKVTVDLEGFNALQLNEWTNPSVIYDYFTFSKADAVTNSAEPLTWRNTETGMQPIYGYEATPQWILDMINTYTSKEHSDYDRQFNIGGTGCPLSYIGDLWIDDICYEYLYGPNYNTGYNDMKFMFDVYERDLTTNTYPSTPTKQMEIKEIKALVASGDYAAYANDLTDDFTATSMANLWFDYEMAAKDSDGNPYSEHLYKNDSYTLTFHGANPIYIKKKLNNIYILQWRGTNCRFLDKKNNDPDYKWSISELKEYMEQNEGMQGFKVYSENTTANVANADGIFELVFDKEVLNFENNGMFRFKNKDGNEGSSSSSDFYICPYNDPNPID